MRKANVIFWSVFVSCSSNLSCAQGIVNLESGFLPPKPASASNPEYVKSRHLEIAVATSSSPDKDGLVVAFAQQGEQSNYYLLTKTPFIHEVKFSDNQYLGGWPLTRWSHIERPPEILSALLNVSQDFSGWLSEVNYTSWAPYPGCLNKMPLRYGDVEGDGDPELVLFLNGELIVFSPKHERTVFATLVDASDWLTEDLGDGFSKKSDVDGESYRHVSETLAVNGISHKAFRAYTKVYLGDFDEDEHRDFLTWEKVYESNKVGESAGFKLISERFRHLDRNLEAQTESEIGVTGEYLPQETSGETVQTWLADNELTWSDGYPNSSECDGEENELIPELHDPLLNDPDVLK